ncbi:carbon-nitrogen hydrolase family protein [Tautonia marina]|uniref:carbon-nitrogen hydrolase family protein n=1 Tax=Tautonia marina TaxID=2653855 RepID=UPI001260B7D7|nr:carbon-nitrogen hydrolase family protein [Tautonia marina]
MEPSELPDGGPTLIQPSELVEEFLVIERKFSEFDHFLSIGLANIAAVVPGIETNKDKIARACAIFKERGVNVAIFPEFSLSGYVWDDEQTCRPYIEQSCMENHVDWVEQVIRPLFDETFMAVVLNGFRHGSKGGLLNSTFVIDRASDWFGGSNRYDKVFLPPIERRYTRTGEQDRLDLQTPWGLFGFTTCYDIMFSQLTQEYAVLDQVDAIIEVASWRSYARRDYPLMNVGTDTYYGDLWDMVLAAKAGIHQVWMIACNAVGVHGISKAKFWGGSGLWAPSGLRLIQSSRFNEELLIVHNIDIKGQRQLEIDDFNYAMDFNAIYQPIHGKRAFTRIRTGE